MSEPSERNAKMGAMPRLADPAIPEDLRNLADALGINRPALAVLLAVKDGEPASFAAISERSGVPAGTLAKQLPHLEDLGFIRANMPREQRKGRRGVEWVVQRSAVDTAIRALVYRMGSAPS